MGLRDPLLAGDIRTHLAERPGWHGGTEQITRTYAVNHDNIPKIVADVWRAADELEHHPDIDVRWDTMRFVLTTHTAGDVVTELDLLLADRIDSIAFEHGAHDGSEQAD